MEFLKGWSRKLVLAMLAVFFLGWLIFFIGFMLVIRNEKNYIVFLCIPEIIAAIGPLVAVVGVVHVATSGPVSAVLGSVTSFLSVFCIMGFGSVLVSFTTILFYLYVLPSSPSPQQKDVFRMNSESWLMLVGSWVASLAWMCVIIAWNCFSYDRKYNQVETIVDEEGNVTERSPGPSRLKRNVMFAGVARKLAMVVLFLLGASWCLYIAGVIEESRVAEGPISNTVYLQGGMSVPLDFSTWSTCVVGLFAILAAVGHTGAYGGASTAMGVFTAILSMFFIASVGSVGFGLANLVYFTCRSDSPLNCKISKDAIPRYVVYQLSGAVGMCIWWACLSALKPFYFKETDKVRNSRRSTRIHQQYMQHQVQEVPYDEERVPLLQGQTDTAANHRNRTHFSVF